MEPLLYFTLISCGVYAGIIVTYVFNVQELSAYFLPSENKKKFLALGGNFPIFLGLL
jgi:hypothetical protein